MNTQENEKDSLAFYPQDIYISRDEAENVDLARISAWSVIQSNEGVRAPIYLKVTSVQWNRSRGGWTFCFGLRDEPRMILRKKEAIIKRMAFYKEFIKTNEALADKLLVCEAVRQRVWVLEWVLQMREDF